MNAYL